MVHLNYKKHINSLAYICGFVKHLNGFTICILDKEDTKRKTYRRTHYMIVLTVKYIVTCVFTKSYCK